MDIDEREPVILLSSTDPGAEAVVDSMIDALEQLRIDTRRMDMADTLEHADKVAGAIIICQEPPSVPRTEKLLVVLVDGPAPAGSGVASLGGAAPRQAGRAWRDIVSWAGARLGRPQLADVIELSDAERSAWADANPQDPLASDALARSSPEQRLIAAQSQLDALQQNIAEARSELADAKLQIQSKDEALADLERRYGAAINDLRTTENASREAFERRTNAETKIAEFERRLDLVLSADADRTRSLEAAPLNVQDALRTSRRAQWLAENCAQRARVEAVDSKSEALSRLDLAVIDWPDNGAVYAGQVRAGTPHGLGELVFTSGDVYAGAFRAGRRSGHGVGYIIAHGIIWCGEWRENHPSGPGAFISKDGRIFEGAARIVDKSPYRDGPGVEWSETGDILRAGVWRSGEFIG